MYVDEYSDNVSKRDMTPEELYSVIVDDVKAIYADESNQFLYWTDSLKQCINNIN